MPTRKQDEIDLIINEMMDRGDYTGALCALIKNAGLTMRLYGKPVTEQELRDHAEKIVDQNIIALVASQKNDKDR